MYKQILKKAKHEAGLFGYKINDLTSNNKFLLFIIEGKYFNIEFNQQNEEINLNTNQIDNISIEMLSEELAEMNCLVDELEPLMRNLLK